MNKLNWYLARLSPMTPAEILWRAARSARIPLDYAEMAGQALLPKRRVQTRVPALYPIRCDRRWGAPESIQIFDRRFPADFPFDWHRDYAGGRQAPRRFARSLDIRDPGVVGDVKYIWEVNRHQHLSALAFSEHPQAAPRIAAALESWLAANPYLEGVNWTSSLEVALRLISWTLLYPALSETLEARRPLKESFAQSVYLHLRHIRRNLSRFSSANNHLIGELAGLFCGAVCFPWWPESGDWRDFARNLLERETLAQFAGDGVNREQAFGYQLFTLELLLLAETVGHQAGVPFGAAFESRLRAAVEFVAAVATPEGELPCYGDSDDGRGFVISPGDAALDVVLELGLREAVSKPTAAARVLLPQEEPASPKHRRRPRQESGARIFREGGMAVLDSADYKLLLDFGPLGYPRTAAHGHADALAILLAAGGRYLLTDAGTYAYHSQPEWRAYFRGTAAHNTVRVDGLDQSVATGRFLWGRQAAASLVRFEDQDDSWLIEATHDGYTRLEDPVLQRRRVTSAKAGLSIRVEDTLECRGKHEVELHWHLHEDAGVTLAGQCATVLFGGRMIAIEMTGEGFELSSARGSEQPILGWRSPSFQVKVPATTLRFAGRIQGTTTIVTRIAAVTRGN